MSIAKANSCSSIVLISFLVCTASTQVTAEEKTKVPEVQIPSPATVKTDPNVEAVDKLVMAYSLIEYGRKNKAPDALVTAARILNATPTRSLEAKPTSQRNANVPPSEEKKERDAVSNKPADLLKEAKEMSGNDPHVVAIADRVLNSLSQKRGAFGGPRFSGFQNVAPGLNLAHEYNIPFKPGDFAVVAVIGGGNSNLDLYVLDQFNNIVARDEVFYDRCRVIWPAMSGVTYRIFVVNRGPAINQYTLFTN